MSSIQFNLVKINEIQWNLVKFTVIQSNRVDFCWYSVCTVFWCEKIWWQLEPSICTMTEKLGWWIDGDGTTMCAPYNCLRCNKKLKTRARIVSVWTVRKRNQHTLHLHSRKAQQRRDERPHETGTALWERLGSGSQQIGNWTHQIEDNSKIAEEDSLKEHKVHWGLASH
jgi:hypothetical protein